MGKVNDRLQQYRDPRWQKLRAEIWHRDKHTCQLCGRSDRTLTVDHGYYEPREKNVPVWEYPGWSLRTVCHDPCNLILRNDRLIIQKALARLGPRWVDDLAQFLDLPFVISKPADQAATEPVMAQPDAVPVDTPEPIRRFLDGCWGRRGMRLAIAHIAPQLGQLPTPFRVPDMQAFLEEQGYGDITYELAQRMIDSLIYRKRVKKVRPSKRGAKGSAEFAVSAEKDRTYLSMLHWA